MYVMSNFPRYIMQAKIITLITFISTDQNHLNLSFGSIRTLIKKNTFLPTIKMHCAEEFVDFAVIPNTDSIDEDTATGIITGK